MPESMLVYRPTARPRRAAAADERTLDTLSGKVVGFIDNSKPNFSNLVDDLSELLVAQYGVSSVLKRKKIASSRPATDAMIGELSQECDLVITGSGD